MESQRLGKNTSLGLDKIVNRVSNISLYDIKSIFRKAQNVVMNYNEIEVKVREATNNEPWGASTTLMQEIAVGTYSYAAFNEIMTMIYRRFTEKSAGEWRQIYKALQLLEFLVKHGSERVIDDARSHISIIKVLRNFHYIDNKGKDRGVNVSNRAKELIQLLLDNDLLKQERKKARSNKERYIGVGSDDNKCNKYEGFGRTKSFCAEYNDETFYGDRRFNNETKIGSYNSMENSIYKASISTFEEYNEFDDDTQYKSCIQQKNNQSNTNLKASTINSKNTVNTYTDLLPFVNDSFNSSGIESRRYLSFKAPSESLNSSTDDKFDEFQSASLPFEYKSVNSEQDNSLLFSSQMSNDSSLTKRCAIQSNQTGDQSLDICSLILQSKEDSLICNFDKKKNTEQPLDDIIEFGSLKSLNTQPNDAFSSIWTAALKDINKSSTEEVKSITNEAKSLTVTASHNDNIL
ncbi:hypothetical protein T552_02766 [Pneumocystis carinii B80]|uniref:ENTH domain-containing protein n=1 Tax=Pneumocystis carinii (strain B80) TaxID=1408658 RepID=A0A0W4ZEF6_PNEC8|nr:hypothetical protein T552_02766 [Pneumocystis carinii B80]KTW26765.1 hypothetical protein T552_02766 [Pneumocystis carinii B80]